MAETTESDPVLAIECPRQRGVMKCCVKQVLKK